jgi:hypothetical protein
VGIAWRWNDLRFECFGHDTTLYVARGGFLINTLICKAGIDGTRLCLRRTVFLETYMTAWIWRYLRILAVAALSGHIVI